MSGDVRAEAIEAAAEAIRCLDGPATIGGTPAATAAVDAATPRLLAPIRALASGWVGTHDLGDAYADEVWQALDAIESEATSEGARDE